MKVQCPKCNTSYKLPRDRITVGTTVKVRCKHCSHVIEVTPTAQDAEEGSTESALPQAALTTSMPAISVPDVKWYLAAGNDRVGPFSPEDVKGRLASKEATLDTLAWRKGFAGWTRLGDIDEFRGALHQFDEDGGHTQLMNIQDVQGSAPDEAAPPAPHGHAPEAGEGGDEGQGGDGMVWQRRETSVLFSLDDYKTRKGTRSVPAIKPLEAPLAVKPVESLPGTSAPAAPAPKPAARMISLDEGEIKHVAEALARRKRQRSNLLLALGGVATLAVVAVGVVLFLNRPAPEPASAPTPAPVAMPAPAPAPVAAPAPAPAPAPEAKAPEAAPAPAKAAPKKADKPVAKGDAAPAPAPEAKPAKAPAPAADDANALLAALSKGREAKPAAGAAAGGTAAAASGGDEGLPAQLTSAQIQGALRKKTAALQQCVVSAGLPLPFRATPRITIAGSGSVTGVSAPGTAGAQGCIEATLRSTGFPRFKGDAMTVPVPIAVQ